MKKHLLTYLLTAVLLLGTVQAAGYLKIGDIKGESTDTKHKDWINILSFEWGAEQSAVSIGSARNQAKRQHKPLVITKLVDKSTPFLAQPVCGGEHFDVLELEICSEGETQHCYLRYELKNVLVSSYQVSGSADDRPTEQISFNYEEISFEYIPQERDGSAGEPISAVCV